MIKSIFAPFFSIRGLLLLVLFVSYVVSDQLITRCIEEEIMSPLGATGWLWMYGFLSLSNGLISPILLTFVTLTTWKFPDRSLFEVADRTLSYLIKESMRVMGQSLLWGLLLVIPGLIRFFQCVFVPYVVLLDPQYQKGEVDALKTSRRRVQKVWARLIVILVVFGLGFPLGMTSFDEWRSFLDHPFSAMAFVPLEIAVLLVFQWLLLRTWERAYESDVSMVRTV